MELFIQRVELAHASVLGSEFLAHEHRRKGINPILLIESGRQFDGSEFDAFADELAFNDILELDQAHGCAGVRLDVDQLLAGQLQDCFAQGRPGYVQLSTQLLLIDDITWLKPQRDDRVPKQVIHLSSLRETLVEHLGVKDMGVQGGGSRWGNTLVY
ncbi:hypothetical protein D9M68_571080 [compost metagenome]